MILVSVNQKEDTQIKISGHAENEAVCHAVSGLFYALLEYLKESGCVLNRCLIREGNSEIIFKRKASEAVKMFICGIKAIGLEHREDLTLAISFAE